jgi:hypothetical protein
MREDTIPKYHFDTACDRAAHNSFGNRARRAQRINELHRLPTGIQQVPDEKTITCPMPSSAASSSLYPPSGVSNSHIGMHTSWLVENTSKLPVVLAYVDFHTGREYSAVNAHISPPHADPHAILMPGQWKSVKTMEGHVFHVYELLPGTSPGNYQMGRLVLQHRVGLIPVQNKYASPETLQCGDPSTIVDEPPLVAVDDDEDTKVIEPEFQRSPEIKHERCNVLYRGFRNLVGCPIHAYYIGQSPPPLGTDGQKQCEEDFKFHLGVNTLATDFEHAWDAPTKFETTFISHSFVFRLASNTSVLVDTHTLAPTQVVDCPESSTAAPIHSRQVSETVEESILLPFGDKTHHQQQIVIQPQVVVLPMVIMSNNGSAHYYEVEEEEGYNHTTATNYFDYYYTKTSNNNNNETSTSEQRRISRQPHSTINSRRAYTAASISGSRVY